MTVLVVGAGGQLGRDVVRLLGDDAMGLTRADLDVADEAAVVGTITRLRPTAIINTAAWTDVDGAESHEADAFAVNCDGPANLARACVETSTLLVHVSTDYVFDGTADAPYDEDAPVAPRSAYGRSKAAGESAVLDSGAPAYVVRTAWLYGAGGRNFVRTMAGLAERGEPLQVVNDQRGSPTWTRHLAGGLVELVERRPAYGIYHATSAGDTTWFDFARAIFTALRHDPDRVRPVATAQFQRPAPRPAYSVLSDRRWRAAELTPLPHWRLALAEAIETLGSQLLTPL